MAVILHVVSLISLSNLSSLIGRTPILAADTCRSATMTLMATPPASTKTSLRQRLSADARTKWPQLAGVRVRFRGAFAYVEGPLLDGDTLPLMQWTVPGSVDTGESREFHDPKETARTIAEIAHSIDIHEVTLGKWVKNAKDAGQVSEPPVRLNRSTFPLVWGR